MKATFNERFAMKTILDFDVFNDEYEPKPVKYHHVLNLLVSFTTLSRRSLKIK